MGTVNQVVLWNINWMLKRSLSISCGQPFIFKNYFTVSLFFAARINSIKWRSPISLFSRWLHFKSPEIIQMESREALNLFFKKKFRKCDHIGNREWEKEREKGRGRGRGRQVIEYKIWREGNPKRKSQVPAIALYRNQVETTHKLHNLGHRVEVQYICSPHHQRDAKDQNSWNSAKISWMVEKEFT